MKFASATYRLLLVILLSLSVFGFAPQEKSDEDIKAIQGRLEKELVSPCQYTEALATHQCGTASAVKGEISSLLKQGKSYDEVRSAMITKYGQKVLILPEATGFNLMAWIFPFVMLFAGLIGIIVFLRRQKQAIATSEAA